MPNTKNTFPVLTKAEREVLDLHLESITKVSRPGLVDGMMGGLNAAPIVDKPGKIGNEAWRTLHFAMAFAYEDESNRNRTQSNAGPQVETVRAYIKRIASAYNEAFGEVFPIDAIKLTLGGNGTVDIWRVR